MLVALTAFAAITLNETANQPTREIGQLVESAIEAGDTPGAVVAIGRSDGVVFSKAYGHRQLEPTREPMTLDTVFDLASLTKPIATAIAVMQLNEREQIDVKQNVSRYLPAFAQQDKHEITIRDLLLHQGGLIADNHLRDYRGTPAESFENIFALKLSYQPRTKFVYSDVGFLVLGQLVEQVSRQPLDEFTRENTFVPLGMTDTRFCPTQEMVGRCAATEKRNDRWLRGVVHDPRAAALDGVAGHAGLFSTAHDLSRLAQALLNGGELGEARILQKPTVDFMTQSIELPGTQRRTLGWDSRSKYSSNRAQHYSDAAFGHGGFTGTSFWIDPQRDLFVIVLCTRLHPDGKGSINRTAAAIGDIAIEIISR